MTLAHVFPACAITIVLFLSFSHSAANIPSRTNTHRVELLPFLLLNQNNPVVPYTSKLDQNGRGLADLFWSTLAATSLLCQGFPSRNASATCTSLPTRNFSISSTAVAEP